MTRQPEPTDRPDEGTKTDRPTEAIGTDQPAEGTGTDPAATSTPLERRYRRLLHAYPAGYRAARGDELVGTYLELAGAGRSWPSPADAGDVLRGGLRQRLREQGASELVAGLPIAAVGALATLTALAAFLLYQVEFTTLPDGVVLTGMVGPAQTLGVFVWAGWLLAGLATAVLRARWARRTVGGAVLLTLATPLVSLLTGLARPPLFVLLPVLALGLTALALPGRPGWTGRIPPVLGALAGTIVALLFRLAEAGGIWFTGYHSTSEILSMTGGLVLGLALAIALLRATLGDGDGLWAFLLLLTPASLLGIRQVAEAYWSQVDFPALATTAVALALLGLGTLLAVIAARGVRHRATRQAPAAGPCPMCGHVAEVDGRPGTATPGTVT
ncbi:GlsB/YeaQ/YmgE family stress response membrane protein [Plantactinospora sp. KLBMP9567]|uniref:GlsB/YeaQ/YmgE family stress response membrane protein n=1 Tax=Plantactinospora sp. KLBMP9567 TaxID=3085900 RepID=UPI00298262F2|nr:GlsB/YeaQ/YmgE family stress response membrane protein [Plantactinospora sp. KLBMP9567]MDW5322913.1 GlsB/YeaQ/YmgE family stress response membrane protein [Plantactinospora sp. KLBMP9567]